MDCLPAAYAFEQLHDPLLMARMDPDGVLELARAAGLDEEAAQKLASDHAWHRGRKEQGG